MSHSFPVQAYKSMLYLNRINDEVLHAPKKGRVNRFGVTWARLEPHWGNRAYELQTSISRNPDDPALIIEALTFIREVFHQNQFGIQTNHYNHANICGMIDDLQNNMIHGRQRIFSQLNWERLLVDDDPEKRGELDSTGHTWEISSYFMDKATKDKGGILDMLCVINTLTKLLQK